MSHIFFAGVGDGDDDDGGSNLFLFEGLFSSCGKRCSKLYG